ncbi:MAG: GNAT family N-acetyltransferase [Sedimenticola sp.]
MDIKPMSEVDIDVVIDVINSHDEDDAEDARNDFERDGFENHWVIELDGVIVGISGYRQIPESYGSGWVSWTYVHDAYCGKGIGKKLFQYVIDHATAAGGQKLFIKVSNYVDEDGRSIYLAATKMYESFGFECEIISKDFYDDGEDQYIYSKNLIPLQEDIQKQNEKPVIRFVDIFEIVGTNGAYSFNWEVQNKSLFQKRSFSVSDLQVGLDAVKECGGRVVYLTFLSNLPLVHLPLSDAGFKLVGQLKDYYEPGIHELHFVHLLD